MCTIATCTWPFFKQAAIMNMAYPLFILVACKSDPLKAYKEGLHSYICSVIVVHMSLHVTKLCCIFAFTQSSACSSIRFMRNAS